MEVSPLSGNSPNHAGTGSQVQRQAISSDFQTFLTMLTAQMQNQDPLNPIQSSDYAVQLATFSGVEQQVKSNDLLESLGRQLGAMGLAQIAGWVGMEAKAPALARFDGSPIEVYPSIAPDADSAVLVVRDDSGAEVSRQPLDPASGPFEWAGVGANGGPVPQGLYGFDVESYSDGSLISTTRAQVYSPVAEVRNVDGVLNIVLADGEEIAAASVSALRAPS